MKKILLLLGALVCWASGMAQDTVTTSPPLINNNGAGGITFEVQSTTPVDITGLMNYFNSGSITAEVWYRIGGVQHTTGSAPSVSVANGWVQHFSGTVAGTGSGPVLIPGWTDLAIPANQRVGIAITGGMSYQTWSASGQDVFTDNTLTVYTGQNIGYGGGGTWPNHPRQFLGSVIYELGVVGNCTPFTNFTIDSVTTAAAKVDWIPGSGNTSFFLEYGPTGFTPGTGTNITGTYPGNQPPVILSGLTSQTGYDLYFGEICNSGADSVYFPAPQKFTTTNPCTTPTNFAVSNVSSTSADFSWNALGTVNNFEIIYGTAGFNPLTGGNSLITTSSTASITTLNPTMDYEAYLIADCGTLGTSDTAGPVTFSTVIAGPRGVSCTTGNPSVLLVEEFNQAGGWTGDIGTGTSNGLWNFRTGTTTSTATGPSGAHSGSHYVYFEASGAGPASLISPSINLTSATDSAELAFWMHAYGADIGYLVIRVSTSSATGPFTDTIFNYTQGQLQTSSSDPWQQVGVRLDQYIGQQIWLEFEANRTTSFNGDIAIDLLTVQACGTFCLPEIFTLNSILPTSNSAVVNVDTFSNNFQFEWGPCGFNQGTGTIISSSSPYTITGLAPNTCYELYVRRDCGANGMSGWGGPFSFTTACAPATAPLIEDFENFTVGFFQGTENCWTLENTAVLTSATNGYNWELRNTVQTSSSGTGPDRDNTLAPAIGGKFFNSDVSYGTTGDSAMLISPIVDLTGLTNPIVEYHMHRWGTQMAALYVDVFDGTQWVNGVHAHTSLTGAQTSAADPYTDTVLDVSTYANANFRVRFRTVSRGCCAGDNALDDIYIGEAPTCAKPFNLGGTGIGVDSALVYWTTGGAGNWDVEYGTAGFTLGTGTRTSVTNDSLYITGLTAGTNYHVYVRDSCGPGDVSLWSGPIPISTAVCPTAQSCVFIADLFDSFGDGWNGAQISFVQNGVVSQTIGSGFTTGTTFPGVQVSLCDNITTYVILSNAGTFPGEIGFDITSPFPTVVATHTATTGLSTGDTLAVFATSCALPSCPNITNPGISALVDTAVTMNWDASAGANSYEVWFGPQGFFQSTQTAGGIKAVVSTNSLNVDTLSPNTCYEFLVRGICAPGDTSQWTGLVSFCTPCSPLNIPYFQSYNTWPLSCWKVDLGAQPWTQQTGAGGDNYAMAAFWSFNNTQFIMESPLLNINSPNAEVRFDWSHLYQTFYPNDELILRARSSNTSTWDTLVQLIGPSFNDPTAGTTAPGAFITEVIALDPAIYNNSLTTFQLIGNSDWGPNVYVNNFIVEEPVPTDLRLISAEFDKNSLCLSNNDTILYQVHNVKGSAYNLSGDPLVLHYDITGPVNSTGSASFSTGSIPADDTATFMLTGVDLSLAGSYSLEAWIDGNNFNLSPVNDTLGNPSTINIREVWKVEPDTVVIITNTTDTVNMKAQSSFFTGDGFFISEICHFKTATGAPVGGWPAYLLADDYIEITGVPGSDLGGITLEQWSTTALQNSHTFPAGTLIGPDGTAIIAVGQPGTSVPSPSNFYYHGNVSTTFSSGGNNGRILKNASGAIIDAVGYGSTYSFPATSGVTAADWSGTTAATSGTSGTRLTGPDINSATNWVVSSATNPQNPNTLNANVPLPAPNSTAGFSWSLNAVVIDSLPEMVVGPYTNSGVYNYIATYNSPCGVFTDTVTVIVSLNCPIPTNLSANVIACDSVDVSWNAAADSALVWHVPTGTTPTGAGTLVIGDSTLNITGTMVNTTYDFYVANICKGDTGSIAGPFSFDTDSVGAPVASFTYSPVGFGLTVNFDASGSTGHGNTYAWDFGDGNLGTGMMPPHTYASGGSYSVTLTVTNACGVDDTTIIIADVSIRENALGRSLNMFPNPASGEVNLSFTADGAATAEVRVTDMTGKTVMLVRQEQQGGGEHQLRLDVSHLADGIYMVEITSGDMKAVRRLIKD